MNILTLKNKKTSTKIRAFIAQAVSEALADPDFGLELSAEAKRRLEKAQIKTQRKNVSLVEIKRKYL